MNTDFAAIRQTEESLINSWPSLRTVLCDGWVFREAGGYTKRANSASALDGHGSFSHPLEQAEHFYGSLGQATIFRLTPLAGSEPDAILGKRGYGVLDETIVMTAALDGLASHEPSVTFAADCTESWEEGYAAAHMLGDEERRAHRAILEKIKPLPTAFATLRDGETQWHSASA